MDYGENFIDIAWQSLNKKNEELCGDKVEIYRDDHRTIAVLADGLGSGVKANILATLTSKMMITLLGKGIELKEAIETIMNTLPICSVRKIAYSTFTVVEINKDLECKVIEYDNPPIFILRDKQILNVEKKEIPSGDRRIYISEFTLQHEDELIICSDGVIHAGVGEMLNHGWEWEHVGSFLRRQREKSAEKINRNLLAACYKLYKSQPGDDTTVVTIKIRNPEVTHIVTGPPVDINLDIPTVNKIQSQRGKKVICGGTAANIFSRVLSREIVTSIDYDDLSVPPIAKIKGFDLVTEGVLTMEKTLEYLIRINEEHWTPLYEKKDGATLLLKSMLEDSTHIVFWVGRAINPAHQNPDFPMRLSIKINIVKDIIKELVKIGKVAELIYTDR